jgi:hypothetical protein
MKTIHLTVNDDEVERLKIILSSLKDNIVNQLTISNSYTYVDDIGDTIEVKDGVEYVVPTKDDIKAMNEKNSTISMDEYMKKRGLSV